ncbi:MAG: hypothetical protein D6676_00330 [Cyanobacteria bacterium J003]|jgi:hypothetical protein|nr:MAG: hypothetical protein D6676_00330 [Cyanobacteria bacterium J003]
MSIELNCLKAATVLTLDATCLNYVEFSIGEHYFSVIFWLSFSLMDLKNALGLNYGYSNKE